MHAPFSRAGLVRPPAREPLAFRRSLLPPGYVLWSDFGSTAIEESAERRAVATSGTVPFGGTAFGVGLDWSAASSTAYLQYPTFAIPALFTMEALFRVGTVQGENVLTYVNNDGADPNTFDRQIVFQSDGRVSFYVYIGGALWITSTSTAASGDIVHIAVTYDGTTYRLYWNGLLEASTAAGAAYGGYTNPVLRAGYSRQNPSGTGFGAFVLPTHTTLLLGLAERALDAGEVFARATRPWAPLVAPRGKFGSGSTVYALTATGIATGAPSVGTPAVSQTHILTATGIATAAPSVGTPAVAQEHALTATGIATGAPSVGSPTIAQIHALLASGIATGAPSVGAPVLNASPSTTRTVALRARDRTDTLAARSRGLTLPARDRAVTLPPERT